MVFEYKFLKYTTDNGNEIIYRLKMSTEIFPSKSKNTTSPTITQRLSRGGFQSSHILSGGCGSLTKKDLIMRYITTKDYGRVYFRTHDEWKNYWSNKNNHNNIIKVCGECLSCRGLIMSVA